MNPYEQGLERVISKLKRFIFSVKPTEDSQMKLGPPRHKQYSTQNRPPTPRTPKHRLSVDPNLQIPEILNSASKKDLLRRVSHKCARGEKRLACPMSVTRNAEKDVTFYFPLLIFKMIIFHMIKKNM